MCLGMQNDQGGACHKVRRREGSFCRCKVKRGPQLFNDNSMNIRQCCSFCTRWTLQCFHSYLWTVSCFFFSSSYSIKIRVMFNYFVKMFKWKINITDLKMGINMLYAVGGTCRIAHGDYHYILFHKKVISSFFLLCTLAQSALWNLHNNMPRLLNLILLEFGFSARVGRICEPM